MTDKQDPIAHAARLLREAAEELRQAHAYNNSEGWENETDAKAAYDEHMAAAQALEDWEQAVGAGGVSGPLMGSASPPTAQAEWWTKTEPLIARSRGEWHEDDGPVVWWSWNGHGWAGESPWCGTPLDSDWPGYHTHWTPAPPALTSAEGVDHG